VGRPAGRNGDGRGARVFGGAHVVFGVADVEDVARISDVVARLRGAATRDPHEFAAIGRVVAERPERKARKKPALRELDRGAAAHVPRDEPDGRPRNRREQIEDVRDAGQRRRDGLARFGFEVVQVAAREVADVVVAAARAKDAFGDDFGVHAAVKTHAVEPAGAAEALGERAFEAPPSDAVGGKKRAVDVEEDEAPSHRARRLAPDAPSGKPRGPCYDRAMTSVDGGFQKTVAVFGATGIFGSRIVAALAAEGRATLAVASDVASVGAFRGVEPVPIERADDALSAADALVDASPADAAPPFDVRRKRPGIRSILVARSTDVAVDASGFDATLRLGGLCGDGVVGPFRPMFESLREGRAPTVAEASREVDFVHPIDAVAAVLSALRYGAEGTFDVVAEKGAFGAFRVRAARVLSTYGLPLRAEDGGLRSDVDVESEAGAARRRGDAASERARRDWAWSPTRRFETATLDLLSRTPGVGVR
jgi:hypothetical protein